MVEVIELTGGGLRARVLTLGAIVQDLRMQGLPFSLVLGSADPADYAGEMRHMGTMTGRFANRIGGAGFVVDGVRHATDPNWLRRHTLHGGSIGAGQRIWRITRRAAHRVTLALDLCDGEMGFPGNLTVQVTIRLGPGRVLAFDTTATTDRATPCSFTHHGYFALDDTGDLRHHRLRIAAARRIETDADLIPTGHLLPVARDLDPVQALDHGFALRRGGRRPRAVAWLTSARTGAGLRVETTAPALQIHNDQMQGRWGVALEAQAYPDAPNHPQFPGAILRPGARWHQSTRYILSTP